MSDDLHDLLQRLTADPSADTVTMEPIPWPEGLAPSPIAYRAATDDPLPEADVLVVTWTSAEWMALADVLTPGVHKTAWLRYAHGWNHYERHLTDRSPARDANCLGEYQLTQIGDKRVLCFHSQLHLATDDDTAPIVRLLAQLVVECRAQLVITTGTAGGIDSVTTGPVALGDVFICSSAKFNCTKGFQHKPWAQQRYSNPCTISGPNLTLAQTKLAQINAARLPTDLTPTDRTYGGQPVRIFISDNTGDVETVDYFGFADTDDSYGIRANDPQAHTEEMDDATLPLALSVLSEPPAWLSIRNASDPQVPSSVGDLEAQSRWASDIYQRWGYTTTLGSAVAVWATIADL